MLQTAFGRLYLEVKKKPVNREGPVSGNQEATQIFIKYMYDLVHFYTSILKIGILPVI